MAIVRQLARYLNHELCPVRALLAGAAGIGKSHLASEMVELDTQIKHVEHDRLQKHKSPCSLKHFDPDGCFAPEIAGVDSFVIDIGGGNIFRPGVDNDARLRSMNDFKTQHHITIVLLSAPRDVVKARYLAVPGSTESAFPGDWLTWEEVELPYWRQCYDHEVDIS